MKLLNKSKKIIWLFKFNFVYYNIIIKTIKVMKFENIILFGTDGECVEVLDEVTFPDPQTMYIYCINVAEEYGFVLEKVQTEFLGEECDFYLCPDTGDFKVEVLSC